MERGLVARQLAVALLVFLLAGCSNYAVQRYSSAADNIAALGSFDVERIAVGKFTAFRPGLRELPCASGGAIRTPDGETFAEFIRGALVADLRAAKVYETAALVVLSGRLDKIGYSSTSGQWNLALTVEAASDRSISVTEDYEYRTSSTPGTACSQAARALMPAVQALLGKVITHPQFSNLVR